MFGGMAVRRATLDHRSLVACKANLSSKALGDRVTMVHFWKEIMEGFHWKPWTPWHGGLWKSMKAHKSVHLTVSQIVMLSLNAIFPASPTSFKLKFQHTMRTFHRATISKLLLRWSRCDPLITGVQSRSLPLGTHWHHRWQSSTRSTSTETP